MKIVLIKFYIVGDIVREEGIEYRKFHSMYRKCMDELKLKRFTVEGKWTGSLLEEQYFYLPHMGKMLVPSVCLSVQVKSFV